MLKLSLLECEQKHTVVCVCPFKCKWAAAPGSGGGASRAHVL